jgi:hypothetical protein
MNDIIAIFDFERVRKAMLALNWTWVGSAFPDEPPTVGELVVKAQKLLKEAADMAAKGTQESYVCSSGGLQATAYKGGSLVLEFIIESADNG